MSPFDHSDFCEALKRFVRDSIQLDAGEFVARWAAAIRKAHAPWLELTSGFNIDTRLLQAIDHEFTELELLQRPEVHEIFFGHQPKDGFNRHLVGRKFEMQLADGIFEQVRIVEVFLGSRLGMGYRVVSDSGREFEFEKFD